MSCISPSLINVPNDTLKRRMYVPCGKCAWCRKRKRDEWFVRFVEEAKENPNVQFITLTYSDENLPQFVDEDTGQIHASCSKEDIQKFIKRARKSGLKFKYFIASEYGGQTQRPHYHGLIFSKNHIDILKHWGKGFTVSEQAGESAYKYTCKYLLKGSETPNAYLKNFSLKSTKPALGASFIDENRIKQMQDREDTQCYILPGGSKQPLPRYYTKKIWDKKRFPKISEEHTRTIIDDLTQRPKYYSEQERYKRLFPEDVKMEKFLKWLSENYYKDNINQYKITKTHE